MKGRKAGLTKGQKFWFGCSAAMTLFLIVLMVYWQFYSGLNIEKAFDNRGGKSLG